MRKNGLDVKIEFVHLLICSIDYYLDALHSTSHLTKEVGKAKKVCIFVPQPICDYDNTRITTTPHNLSHRGGGGGQEIMHIYSPPNEPL
jgi:hypothetical protein